GRAGRAAALPARNRHALGGRVVRRDRRLRPLRPPCQADPLPRARPFRETAPASKRRQGAITKTGSRHARRLLVEAAWHYRRPPRKGTTLQRRQQNQPAQTIAISWKAQQRLHHIWHRLDTQRGKRKTLVAVAVARHLAGFCWAITNSNPDA